MFVTNKLKALDKQISSKHYDKAEALLVELSNELNVTLFDQYQQKYKPGLLTQILGKVLPITYHENLKLRMQAESFLTRWAALLSAFAPEALINAFQGLDISTLQPAAHAAIFIYYSNALRFVNPNNRLTFIGMCHSLLLSSQPELLVRVTNVTWNLLRDTLTINNLKGVVEFLLNSPLIEPVAWLCEKEPPTLFPIVAKQGTLQFIKEFIPKWPKLIPIDIKLLSERLIETIKSNNSNEISAAIEILALLIARLTEPPCQDDTPAWTNLFSALEELFSSSATLAQKAAILDLFADAATIKMIQLDQLQRFLVFDNTIPTSIRVSIIHVAALFVNQKKIPNGLIQYLLKIVIERDPLLFIAVIKFLAQCFNSLFSILPDKAEKLLDYVLNPLSRYFVEQIEIVRLLGAIDWEIYKPERLKPSLKEIVIGFIKEPHPSVIAEMISFVRDHHIVLTYSDLDWFENAPYYLDLIHNCEPKFLVELIDHNLLPAASFPAAAHAIAHLMIKENIDTCHLIFKRALKIVLSGLKALKLDYDQIPKPFKKMATNEWKHISDSLPQLLSVINDNVQDTDFGHIIEGSLRLIVNSLNVVQITLDQIGYVVLLNIARSLGSAFPQVSLKLVRLIHRKHQDIKVDYYVKRFFNQAFPYENSVLISHGAIECLPESELRAAGGYVNYAVDFDRTLFKKLTSIVGKPTIPHNTFLEFKDTEGFEDYIQDCIKELPFNQWFITENDFEFIGKLSDIETGNVQLLDDIHKKVIEKYPQVFKVEGKIHEEPNYEINYQLRETTTLDKTPVSEFDDPEPEEVEVAQEIEVSYFPYNGYPSNTTYLYTFLYFSSRKIDDEFKWKEIENFTLNHPNIKFAIAFLAYANRHQLPIDYAAWATKLNKKRFTEVLLLPVGLYFSLVHVKWEELSQIQNTLIEHIMTSLGYQEIETYMIVKGFKSEHGLRRFFFESLIRIDLTHFEEDFKYLTYLFKTKEEFMDIMEEMLECLSKEESVETHYEIYSCFALHLFTRIKDSHMHNLILPPNIPILDNYRMPWIGIAPVDGEKIDQKLIQHLIDFVEQNRTCDLFMFDIIKSMKLNRETYRAFSEATRWLTKSHRLSIYNLYPQMQKVQMQKVNKPLNYNVNPPSYTREATKLFLQQIAEPLADKEVGKYFAKGLSVFSEFLFTGFEKFPYSYNRSFVLQEESILYLTDLKLPLFHQVKTLLHNVPSCTANIGKMMLDLPKEKICTFLNTTSKETADTEICQMLLDVLKTQRMHLYDAVNITKVIKDSVPLNQLMMDIVEQSFLNAPIFSNVFIAFCMIEAEIIKSGDETLTETWKQLLQALPDKLQENAKNLELLQAENKQEAFTRIYQ